MRAVAEGPRAHRIRTFLRPRRHPRLINLRIKYVKILSRLLKNSFSFEHSPRVFSFFFFLASKIRIKIQMEDRSGTRSGLRHTLSLFSTEISVFREILIGETSRTCSNGISGTIAYSDIGTLLLRPIHSCIRRDERVEGREEEGEEEEVAEKGAKKSKEKGRRRGSSTVGENVVSGSERARVRVSSRLRKSAAIVFG